VEHVLDPGEAREVGVVGRGEGLVGRVARAVRVVGEAVGERGLKATAAPGGDRPQLGVEAAECAQEGQRACVGVTALEVASGGGVSLPGSGTTRAHETWRRTVSTPTFCHWETASSAA